jgi:tetratricopeptide (TPR) repeat protein
LPRSVANEVAISCAYMLTMLALGAIYYALHQPNRRQLWLAAGSLAYGLAVGARPTLVFGAIILLAPVAQAWRERRAVWQLLMAAVVPITLIGVGLMLYNARRFNSPFEFGIHYQLLSGWQATQQFFSLRYLWFNFRAYFLEPVRWGRHFPFVGGTTLSPLPAGHGAVDYPFGILSDTPVVWLAVALPLAWRGRTGVSRSQLQGFIAVVALFWGICALMMDLYYYTGNRFEAEILPTLVLLAVVGLLGLERALADQPGWRRVARGGWGLLLGFSIAFNLLASVERCAAVYSTAGDSMQELGKMAEAKELFQHALRMNPDYAFAHNNLGNILLREGKVSDAVGHYEQALRIKPDFAEAHCNLGIALEQTGRRPEAIEHWEQALRINPDYAEAHYHLGVSLVQLGRLQEAMGHWEQALRIKPDYADAHYNLGVALSMLGRLQEAMGHWEQALQINPDYAEAHYCLGVALAQTGKTKEAIAQYEQALRIKPDYAEAQNALARLQAGQ